MEKQFANGIYFNKKHEKAPDFVLGSLSIHKEKFTEFIKEQETNEEGYIKLDILEGREKPYIVVNDYGIGTKKKDYKEENHPSDILY